MMLQITSALDEPIEDFEDWPAQARLIVSSLESAQSGNVERRRHPRLRYRTRAQLTLFVDGPNAPPRLIFARDVCSRSLGFICPKYVPLGYGGQLEIRSPDGCDRIIYCTVLRSRKLVEGWYEGAVYFNRDQSYFRACPIAPSDRW